MSDKIEDANITNKYKDLKNRIEEVEEELKNIKKELKLLKNQRQSFLFYLKEPFQLYLS